MMAMFEIYAFDHKDGQYRDFGRLAGARSLRKALQLWNDTREGGEIVPMMSYGYSGFLDRGTGPGNIYASLWLPAGTTPASARRIAAIVKGHSSAH
jgi:hypothetical protein